MKLLSRSPEDHARYYTDKAALLRTRRPSQLASTLSRKCDSLFATPARVLYHQPLRYGGGYAEPPSNASTKMRQCCLFCIVAADMIFSVGLRLLGPVLVLLANGLIGLVVYIYLTVLYPQYLLPAVGTIPAGLIVCFGIFCSATFSSTTGPVC